MNSHSLDHLLRKTFSELPSEQIYNVQQATLRFGINTFDSPTKIAAAISIDERIQIAKLLQFANQNNLGICPLSSGNNWGYGSVNPINNKALIVLDLSKLKRIIPIDKELGFIALEPGVTQQDLAEFLDNNNWNFMTPVTGAGPSCSIISNALERGYGITPYTDHFMAASSFRYFIPHPKLCDKEFYSPLASLDKSVKDPEKRSVIDASYKWGLGPNFDGLLTQSNLAIVSEMSLRLAPIPNEFRSFYIQCSSSKSLKSVVNFIQKLLKEQGANIGSVNLMDKRRVVAMVAENPNGPEAHKVMSDEQLNTIIKQYKLPEWTIVGSIYSTKDTYKSVKRYIRTNARFASKVLFSDSLFIKLGNLATRILPARFLEKERKQLLAMNLGIEIMLGKPNQVALPLAYWRNPDKKGDISQPLLPDKDECGLLWYAPLLEMSATKIEEFVDFIRTTTPRFGIEPLITFTNLSFSCVDSTVPIVFSLNNLEARQKAHDCLEQLFDEGLEKGFVPYRLPVDLQATKLDPEEPHWLLTRHIKSSLDPNNILNPSRYCP
jgi:4-cresol dehydrogenase (hydroxylating)